MIASLIVLKRDCICCSKFCTKIVRSSVDCMAAGSAAAASAPAPAASALLGSSACGGRQGGQREERIGGGTVEGRHHFSAD